MIGLRPSSLSSRDCVVPLMGDSAIFCHAGSGQVGRVWSAKEKFLETLCHRRELNPGHRADRQWDTFILPLSYHNWHNQIITPLFYVSLVILLRQSLQGLIKDSFPNIHCSTVNFHFNHASACSTCAGIIGKVKLLVMREKQWSAASYQVAE